MNKNYLRFLLDTFFKNESHPGWETIATDLISNGVCIVAGDKCIWHGGIGNFIATEKESGVFGCLRYKFDLHGFRKSKWYLEVGMSHIEQLYAEMQELKNKKDGMFSVLSEIGGDILASQSIKPQ